MGRIILAFKAFFIVLFNAELAAQVRRLLAGAPEALPQPAAAQSPQAVAEPPTATVAPPAAKPPRSEALTLLAALQREARLVDFLQEPIADYSDAQVGAAVRDIHRQCAQLLQRMFALAPLAEAAEGDVIEVPSGFDAARFHLTGNVSGQPPFRGTLCHHGWAATRCELPSWKGDATAAMIVAPIEVEVR